MAYHHDDSYIVFFSGINKDNIDKIIFRYEIDNTL